MPIASRFVTIGLFVLYTYLMSKSPQRQLGDGSSSTYTSKREHLLIPPTAVGGSLKPNLSAARRGLLNESVGWTLTIPQLPLGRFKKSSGLLSRLSLNNPPTTAGGIQGTASEIRRYEDSRISMACAYAIVVYGDDLQPLRQAVDAAFDEVDRIDRLMSHYKPDSPLSRLNREAAKGPVKVEPELFDFIAECLRYSRESDGGFDITVGPLMKAWGFFRGEGRMPSEQELSAARRGVGYRHVILNKKQQTIYFDRPGVELDLGGIAKGYAVDRAVAVLKQSGIKSALVSAGGSTIYGLSAPPNEAGWEVKVQDPIVPDKIAMTVRLKDQALSVSGSYEKFFELGGRRYSHIMDPRTGKPVEGVLSVAVITANGTAGDALDNVFYVQGVEWSKKSLQSFPVSKVIFFLPDPGSKWRMETLQQTSLHRR